MSRRPKVRQALQEALEGRTEPILLQELAMQMGRPYASVYGAARHLVAARRIELGLEPHGVNKARRRVLVAPRGVDLPDPGPDPLVEVEDHRIEIERYYLERAERMFAAFADDLTLEEVAERFGMTRERVRQILMRHDPTMYRLLRIRRRARARLQRMVEKGEVPTVRECEVCGKPFNGPAWRRWCSPLHSKIGTLMRYQAEPDFHENHKRNVAAWTIQNQDEPWQIRHAHRVLEGAELNGNHRGGTRYLLPGSLPYHWALRACALGWPLFDRLHPDVQAQVREALGHEKETTDHGN